MIRLPRPGLLLASLFFWFTAGPLVAAEANDLPESTTFAVTANGSDVPVFRYEDLDVAHFPFPGDAQIAIKRIDGQTIGEHRIRPERLGYRGEAQGPELRFALDRPRQLVINIGKLRKLLLIAEPPGPGKPSGPDVVNAVAAGADPTGEADSTTALQKAIDGYPAVSFIFRRAAISPAPWN